MVNKIDRELISELFDKYIDYDKFEDIVYGDRQTESFIIFYDFSNEDLFIIYKDIDHIKMLCWYKLWHVGRCFNLVGINNKEELEEFFKELGNELKEESKSQEIPLFEGTMEQLDNLTILKEEGK